MIEKGYKNQIHSRTAFGESPINRAVAAQEFEITDLLIKMGSNLNDQKSYVSYSPLMTAALIGKTQKEGREKHVIIVLITLIWNQTICFLLGNEKIVELLLDNGADMFIKSTYGATARTLAESGGMSFQPKVQWRFKTIIYWFQGYWKIVHLLDAYAVRKFPKSTGNKTWTIS